MNFNFAAPQMLWLLLIVIPPLVLFLWWAWRKREQLITQFISARLLGTLKVGVSPSRQKLRLVLLVAAVALLIISLARPQWGFTMEEAKQRGLDIIIAIDTSNSMLAEDFPPNRLTRAKLAAMDLMRRSKTDRLGLIAFAGTAFMQCPLTLDDAAFGQSVDSLDTKTISQGGTALAEAIDTAQTAFKDEGDNHKVLVLFTDGEDHDGGAVKAAENAAKEGMRIFTVGIGNPEGEKLRVQDERGRVDYIRDEAGNPVTSRLNETLLQDIAGAAGGFYLPLRGTKTMDTLYERGLAPLPKSTNSSKLLRRYHERFHWFVGLAIALLLLEMFLPDRKRKRSAASAATPVTTGALTETVALLLLLALPTVALGSTSSALHEYNQGKYEEALKEYNQALERKKDDPRLHFNAGTAAYQSRQLTEATNQLNQALSSQDLQLQQRAYYNLGNALYRLGQQESDPAKKQALWENATNKYDCALKLNQQDADAGFNKEYVHQQLEELKKQQQQQKPDQSKDKSNDKKDQNQQGQSQNDSNKDQNQQPQDQQQQSNQDSSQPKQDSQARNQKQDQKQSDKDKQDQKQDQQSQAQNKKDQAEKQKQDAQNQSGDSKDKDKSQEDAEREAAAMAAGQMTPKQAQQLLDAQKGDDQVLRLASPNQQPSPNHSFKNW
ncbi:MAG: Mg-chelatase subunit ChlD [Pedosphaera sp.]|nr:Mg-chelatase subunit ChlD [Pedosphaera sp.]